MWVNDHTKLYVLVHMPPKIQVSKIQVSKNPSE